MVDTADALDRDQTGKLHRALARAANWDYARDSAPPSWYPAQMWVVRSGTICWNTEWRLGSLVNPPERTLPAGTPVETVMLVMMMG